MNNTTPLTPVPGQTFGPLVRAMRIAAGGSLAITAEDEAGLAILQFGGAETDSDGDGLPDVWEQLIVDANPNDAIASIQQVATTDDFDGDGLSNYSEYLAGTLPADANSVFAVACATPPGGGQAAVRWNSVAGKFYTIYKSTNLLTGFQAIQTDIPGTPPINTFNDSAPGGMAFYMIGVR